MMGLLMNQVSFNGRTPSLTDIVDKITEISGLEISIEDKPDSHYGFNAYLSFSDTPDNQLQIDDRRPTNSYILRSSLSEDNESIDSQTINLRMYLGQEETLFFITTIALEQLGGSSRFPLSEEMRQQYSTKLTSSELKGRYQLNGMAILRFYIILIVSLPVLIPYWIIRGIIFSRQLKDLRNNLDKYLED
jgi:hypothetical protein